VKQPWFKQALRKKADVIVVLAHMGYNDYLVDVIYDAIRKHDDRPIVFLTGHTHVRASRVLDKQALVMESGHYLDTVGHVTVHLNAGISNITRRYMDANVQTFKHWAHVQSKLSTPAGDFLESEIVDARTALQLDQVLGCSPIHYYKSMGLENETSLWGLYLHKVIPDLLFNGSAASMIMVASTGALRYDIYDGEFVRDDAFTVSPFRDVFHMVPDIDGDTIKSVMGLLLENAHLQVHTAMRAPDPRLPDYAASAIPQPGVKYALAFNTYDKPTLLEVLHEVTGAEPPPVQPLHHDTIDSSLIWELYAQKEWKC